MGFHISPTFTYHIEYHFYVQWLIADHLESFAYTWNHQNHPSMCEPIPRSTMFLDCIKIAIEEPSSIRKWNINFTTCIEAWLLETLATIQFHSTNFKSYIYNPYHQQNIGQKEFKKIQKLYALSKTNAIYITKWSN